MTGLKGLIENSPHPPLAIFVVFPGLIFSMPMIRLPQSKLQMSQLSTNKVLEFSKKLTSSSARKSSSVDFRSLSSASESAFIPIKIYSQYHVRARFYIDGFSSISIR